MIRRRHGTPGRPVVARLLATAVVAALGMTTIAGCASETRIRSQKASEATIVPTDRAKVPTGWTVHRGPGFTVAVPPDWRPRPDDQRAAPQAALEVGIPFTGQATSPAVLIAFVERGQVGPLVYREPILRAQLEAGLSGATLGDSTRIEIAGSTDALYFDVLYEDEGGTSVLGTKLEPTVFRQRELIIETPGLPKYGFRFAVPQDQFDEQVWQQIARSVVVTVGAEDPGTATATTAG